jgi:hypothetical protein
MSFIEKYQQQELSSLITGVYNGQMVISDIQQPIQVTALVEPLSDSLVRLTFDMEDRTVHFRAILSEESGDVHMIIQEKVTDDYILNGVRGFLCQKPNIHGGYIKRLRGFYFHLLFNHFSGKYRECYFFGKASNLQAIAV